MIIEKSAVSARWAGTSGTGAVSGWERPAQPRGESTVSKQGNCRSRRGLRAVALVLSVALASLGLFTGCKDKNHGLKKDSPVSISI